MYIYLKNVLKVKTDGKILMVSLNTKKKGIN